MLEEEVNYVYYYTRGEKEFVTPALQIALNRTTEANIRARNPEGKYVNITCED